MQMQNKDTQALGPAVNELWDSLSRCGLPVHSLLADQGGRILLEQYKAPYGPQDLHRMFSITKSFCSLAVGFLLDERKLSLDDRITDYFPEYCQNPDRPIHPWLETMTIRHMLSMETCYSSTTYKADMGKNWVESFFTTAPSHRSGQIFQYDTSSSHTLAALVKKLSGKGVLDYLREKCLDSLGFSKAAYLITDPFGAEMGGSGLMALPMDLLKTGRFCMDTIRRGEGVFADYLREAVSCLVPTAHSGQTPDEQQGYGYQFWQIRDGFAMYGMGGQYVLFYPQLDLVLVMTADTQNYKGGYQKLLDLVHECLTPFLAEAETGSDFPAAAASPIWYPPFSASYRFCSNSKGFCGMELSYQGEDGLLKLEKEDLTFTIPFSFRLPAVSVLEGYQQRIAVQARFLDKDSLYLPIQLVDECVGSIHILIHLDEAKATVYMRKVEETYFQEFQGFFELERC